MSHITPSLNIGLGKYSKSLLDQLDTNVFSYDRELYSLMYSTSLDVVDENIIVNNREVQQQIACKFDLESEFFISEFSCIVEECYFKLNKLKNYFSIGDRYSITDGNKTLIHVFVPLFEEGVGVLLSELLRVLKYCSEIQIFCGVRVKIIALASDFIYDSSIHSIQEYISFQKTSVDHMSELVLFEKEYGDILDQTVIMSNVNQENLSIDFNFDSLSKALFELITINMLYTYDLHANNNQSGLSSFGVGIYLVDLEKAKKYLHHKYYISCLRKDSFCDLYIEEKNLIYTKVQNILADFQWDIIPRKSIYLRKAFKTLSVEIEDVLVEFGNSFNKRVYFLKTLMNGITQDKGEFSLSREELSSKTRTQQILEQINLNYPGSENLCAEDDKDFDFETFLAKEIQSEDKNANDEADQKGFFDIIMGFFSCNKIEKDINSGKPVTALEEQELTCEKFDRNKELPLSELNYVLSIESLRLSLILKLDLELKNKYTISEKIFNMGNSRYISEKIGLSQISFENPVFIDSPLNQKALDIFFTENRLDWVGFYSDISLKCYRNLDAFEKADDIDLFFAKENLLNFPEITPCEDVINSFNIIKYLTEKSENIKGERSILYPFLPKPPAIKDVVDHMSKSSIPFLHKAPSLNPSSMASFIIREQMRDENVLTSFDESVEKQTNVRYPVISSASCTKISFVKMDYNFELGEVVEYRKIKFVKS